MKLKDLPEECQHCANLKAWSLYMDGNHDYTCLEMPMTKKFLSRDYHNDPCKKFTDRSAEV